MKRCKEREGEGNVKEGGIERIRRGDRSWVEREKRAVGGRENEQRRENGRHGSWSTKQFGCATPAPSCICVEYATSSVQLFYFLLEMWANAQRDGRPAEYRWRPLFNAAKFGWRPLLDAVQ